FAVFLQSAGADRGVRPHAVRALAVFAGAFGQGFAEIVGFGRRRFTQLAGRFGCVVFAALENVIGFFGLFVAHRDTFC
ncbi:MAG: hypothetical protein ACKOJB_12285, partial [Chthoniobacterales bacterium]